MLVYLQVQLLSPKQIIQITLKTCSRTVSFRKFGLSEVKMTSEEMCSNQWLMGWLISNQESRGTAFAYVLPAS